MIDATGRRGRTQHDAREVQRREECRGRTHTSCAEYTSFEVGVNMETVVATQERRWRVVAIVKREVAAGKIRVLETDIDHQQRIKISALTAAENAFNLN